MHTVIFATTNTDKFATAQHTCTQYDISVVQEVLDVPEIQGEDPERIAIDKATKAFTLLQKPVVITDDSWSYAGLKGFPGAYMHSMNEWFTPEDFLRLVLPLTDRTATLTQYLVYYDGSNHKIFSQQTQARLLKEIRGKSQHSNDTITVLDGDNGLSVAEVHAKKVDKSKRKSAQVWHEFSKWYRSTQ